jgi:AraC-like DNA-binding protein
MSSRHFARAFIAETGTTPSKAIERLRIEVARQRVQSSSNGGTRSAHRFRSALCQNRKSQSSD